jgi:alcohol dehydrogenase class IV
MADDQTPPPPAPADETIFTYGAPPLKMGAGAAAEIGFDLVRLGARRVLVVTDAGVAATGAPARIAEAMGRYGVAAEVFDGVHVEPTDASLRAAADRARATGPWDAYVAVGGGSSIDTAKAVALLTTSGGDLMDYVNPPVGAGRAPQRPPAPVVAVPTTTGTGAESTTVCVLDVLSLKVKTGISHPLLRPVLAVVDPLLSMTLPPEVVAASAMDILCHALESFTARPYTAFPARRAEDRVPYCGANPVSDVWVQRALTLLSGSLLRAVRPDADLATRGELMAAATFAGLGFGNAGVHIPHANGYPIAGRVRDFRPPGYPSGEAMVPHGMSVVLTAPAAFRFTFEASPQRHVRAARLLAPDARSRRDEDLLPDVVISLMRAVGMPPGLGAIGYTEADVPDLVAGAAAQQRLLAIAPRAVTEDDLASVLTASFTLW